MFIFIAEKCYLKRLGDYLIPNPIGSVFANNTGDRSSISSKVIPKTQKCYLMPFCVTLRMIRYVSRVKGSNAGKGVAPSTVPWCRSD